jgi:glycerate dehydrogenase
MKIVVLDGSVLNPGDLSWEPLHELGPCTIFDRTEPSMVLERAAGAEILLVNKTPLPRTTIAGLTGLRFIAVLATGYNLVDVFAARERGIPVSNVPSYGTASVAQMVFAHLLNITQQVGHHAQTVREGRWSASPDWCYWDLPLIELEGLTMGIFGFGRIGAATARLARAFGMEVLATDTDPAAVFTAGIRPVETDDLFRMSDVLTLHCPLTADTAGLVNARTIGLMKRTAILINTSRGALVDSGALSAALNEGRIAGAGLDVLPEEPPPPDNPLLSARNCSITPHNAWATYSARKRLLDEVVENVSAFLRGTPRNVVNDVPPRM